MDPNCLNEFCKFCEVDNPCYETSLKDRDCCEKHQSLVTSENLEKWLKIEKKYAINKINYFLNRCEAVHGKKNRVLVCKQLYDFLLKHKRFVYNHKTFADVCLDKLYEFCGDPFLKEHPEVFSPENYIQEMFPKLSAVDRIKMEDIVFDF